MADNEKAKTNPEEEENGLLNPDDFDDDTDESDKTGDEDEKSKTSSKSDEEEEKAKRDAHFAKLRREKEAREKEAKEKHEREERERKIKEAAKLEGELGMIKVNPYTEKPIVDEEDIKIFKLQRQLEDEGKDPIADLPERIADERRKAAKMAAEEETRKKQEETERQAKIDEEIKELREKYPKLDTAKLVEDPLYMECMKGKAGRWSQVEIYELYLGKKAEADKKAAEEKTKKTVDENADKMSKTPSSNSKGKLSASDIANMSDKEFDEYWAKHYS